MDSGPPAWDVGAKTCTHCCGEVPRSSKDKEMKVITSAKRTKAREAALALALAEEKKAGRPCSPMAVCNTGSY